MTEKDLRHLGRRELLEILIQQTKKTSELQSKVKVLEAELEEKRIKVAESGSMADAVMTLNNLFSDADKAADQYIKNIRLNEAESKRVLEEAKKQADSIVREAEAVRSEKFEEASRYMRRAQNAVNRFLSEHPEIKIKIKD